MVRRPQPYQKMLLAGLLASSIFTISSALTQSAQAKDKSGESQPLASTPPVSPAPRAAPLLVPRNEKQTEYYRRRWGIDNIVVKEVASGSLIRFSYRVVDAEKAKILNDKRATPYLIDEKNGLALQVPTLEQIGQLRQVARPQNGRQYWMAFSNKGRYVKPGSHVTLVIGGFRAEGLVVEGFPSGQAR